MAADKRTVHWSPEAIVDLDNIWSYYSGAAGLATADGLIRNIGKIIALIEEHPFAGRARDDIRLDLRSLATSPHVVFYRVRGHMLEIVRVLDGRQDIEEIFAAEN